MPNYDINYDDKRLTEVKADEKAALNEVDVNYGNTISKSDKYFDDQIQASKDWVDKQTELQNQKTDFAIEKIEQEKAQAKKDYIKEQSGAYVDWRKQSNEYGAKAEEMAASGLSDTGYSESSQVSMYNTYQNRVATAREAFVLAKQNYDNAIAEARLQNSSVLAEIAYEAYQKQLELSLQGFQYKNQLLSEQADRKLAVQQLYHNKWQDTLQQINTENALKEQVRVNDAAIAHQKAQEEIQRAQLAEERRQFNILHPANTGGSSGGSSGGKVKGGNTKTRASSTGNSSSIKADATKTFKNDQKSSGAKSGKKSSVSVDMDSVIALGYGPISAKRLSELESQGLIQSYQDGNKIKFRKSPYTNRQSMLFR